MSSSIARAHADAIGQVRVLAEAIPAETVARAFVASLGLRDLEARSALGSYALARVIPDHPLLPIPRAFATICSVCGWSQVPHGQELVEEETQTHYAVERRRFGGLRHLDPLYAAFDLSAFREAVPPAPTPNDWHRLNLILRTPRVLAPAANAQDLQRALKAAFPSNRNECATLIRILAFAGILEAPEYPGFFDRFVPADLRPLPPQRFADWGYPAIWWRARHGVRAAAVRYWFPEASSLDAA